MINEIDRQQPDAILSAAQLFADLGKDWKELAVLAYPDSPFQFHRAIVRALKLVNPEISVVTEDERSMVVHLPNLPENFFSILKIKVENTPEGTISSFLSDSYRFSFPELGIVDWSHVIDIEEYIKEFGRGKNGMTDVERFGMMAIRKFWDDMAEQVDSGRVKFARERSIESYGQWALSYEGYLATLKAKIEEVLPQINLSD